MNRCSRILHNVPIFWMFFCLLKNPIEKATIKIIPRWSLGLFSFLLGEAEWQQLMATMQKALAKAWGGKSVVFYRKIPMKIWDDLWMMTGFLALCLKKPTQNHRLPPTFVKKNLIVFQVVLYFGQDEWHWMIWKLNVEQRWLGTMTICLHE